MLSVILASKRELLTVATLAIILFFRILPAYAGEPQWTLVTSPHFSVLTDGGEKQGRDVALRFEQMRTIFGTLILKDKDRVNVSVPLQIIAFRNQKELRGFSTIYKGKAVSMSGFFLKGQDRDFIALDLSGDNKYHAVFHEYAHLLLNSNFRQTPVWFDEGFAEYYATIRVTGNKVAIGDAEEEQIEYLRDRPISSARLFAIQHESKEYNEDGPARADLYKHAWLMVHYLFDAQKLKEADRYFSLTMKDQLPIGDAVQKAFGVTPKELDKIVDTSFRTGKLKYYTTDAPAWLKASDFSAQSVSTTDARAMLADLHLHEMEYQTQAVQEFEAVLQTDPNCAIAHRGLGYAYLRKDDYERAREHFRRAISLNAGDARVHYYAALLTQHEGFTNATRDEQIAQMKADLEKAIALEPGLADSYSLLAYTQDAEGDTNAAIETMKKAMQLDPRNEYYQLNMGRFLARRAKWDDAAATFGQLKSSGDPQIVREATADMEQVEIARKLFAMRDQELRERDEAAAELAREDVAAESPEKTVVKTVVKQTITRVKFLKGRLADVACEEDGSAVLTITAAKMVYKMHTGDRANLALINAHEFSCDWKNVAVAVNYWDSGKQEGELVSLEMQ